MTETEVRDARPPAAVVAMLNPLMRALFRTGLGRAMRSMALLEFSGRTSGRTYRIPVGWHQVADTPTVFSPARWPANFAGGSRVVVHHRGRAMDMTGTLVTDPQTVADALNAVLAAGTRPAMVGLRTSRGHRLTAEDARSLKRAMIVLA